MNRSTKLALAVTAGCAAFLGPAAAASAAGTEVHARDGVIYAADGTRLTDDEVNSQPVVSPDGAAIAYVHNGTVWVMDIDGTDQRQVSDRIGANPGWSANGTWVTYKAQSCTGARGTFRVDVSNAGAASQPMLPRSCRNQPAPQVGFING